MVGIIEWSNAVETRLWEEDCTAWVIEWILKKEDRRIIKINRRLIEVLWWKNK
jgi:hypothetical protein